MSKTEETLRRELEVIQGEALLYRQKLEHCYDAARLAIRKKSVAAFFEVDHLVGLRIPAREEVSRQWVDSFMREFDISAQALENAQVALRRIESLASRLGTEDSTELLRQEILAEARHGLAVVV